MTVGEKDSEGGKKDSEGGWRTGEELVVGGWGGEQ